MKNLLVRILSAFVGGSEKRKAFRAKYLVQKAKSVFDSGLNNHCILVKETGEEIETTYIKGLKITFSGNNNLVKIYEPYWFEDCDISLDSGSKFIIKETEFMNQKIISEGSIRASNIIIGKNFSSNGIAIVAQEQGCNITIGEDCMFGMNVIIRPTDSHMIYDEKTHEVINRKQPIEIGNHVWLGKNTTILKGSYIPDNSIVGIGSIYTKSSCKDKTIKGGVYVGNPAKIKKNGVNWSRFNEQDFLMRNKQN